MMSDSSNGDLENSYPAPPPPEPMFAMGHTTSQSGISVDDENPGLDRGHSLPNVDELKTEHRAKSAEFVSEDGEMKRRSGWVVWVALCLALVVIAVIIGVAVAVTKEDDRSKVTSSATQTVSTSAPVSIDQKPDQGKDTGNDVTSVPATVLPATPPTVAPASAAPVDFNSPEVRTAQFKDYLISQGISTEADLNTQGSPQQKALNFIAVLDGAKKAVPAGGKDTAEGYDLLQRYVLSVLFYQTHGDRWTYSLNFLTQYSVCYWYSVLRYPDNSQEFRGVACTENGQVAALFMTRLNIEGEMPKEFALLTTLRGFDFNYNLFRGPLPDSMQGMTNLQNLFLMSNRITGTLPSWIDKMVSLRNINLSHNILTGRIPTTMGNLQNMKGIALDNNILNGNLDGVFDTSVVPGFRKLEQLYLENNELTGTIGEHFGALANFTHLDISDNSFRGVIPTHLFQMTNLKVLDLHDNEFTTMPSQFQANTKLELLALHKNNFANQRLPTSINQLKKLTHFDVSQNQFTGPIPTEFGTLSDLSYLFLAENDLSASPIPSWIKSLTKLEELSLKSTKRTGTIPNYIGNMSKMVLLDLDDNALDGSIPENLGDLTDLRILLLNRNSLSSVIPTSFKNLLRLKLFFVEGNQNITGDLDDLFCTNPVFEEKVVLVADCSLCSAAQPDCCTACCEKGEMCNPGVHVPDLDPIWQMSYDRTFFAFGREDYFDKETKGQGIQEP